MSNRIEKEKKTQPQPRSKKSSSSKKTVLGRFLHKLNGFCKDEYGLDVDISDYHVYEFAKVRIKRKGEKRKSLRRTKEENPNDDEKRCSLTEKEKTIKNAKL